MVLEVFADSRRLPDDIDAEAAQRSPRRSRQFQQMGSRWRGGEDDLAARRQTAASRPSMLTSTPTARPSRPARAWPGRAGRFARLIGAAGRRKAWRVTRTPRRWLTWK